MIFFKKSFLSFTRCQSLFLLEDFHGLIKLFFIEVLFVFDAVLGVHDLYLVDFATHYSGGIFKQI